MLYKYMYEYSPSQLAVQLAPPNMDQFRPIGFLVLNPNEVDSSPLEAVYQGGVILPFFAILEKWAHQRTIAEKRIRKKEKVVKKMSFS